MSTSPKPLSGPLLSVDLSQYKIDETRTVIECAYMCEVKSLTWL